MPKFIPFSFGKGLQHRRGLFRVMPQGRGGGLGPFFFADGASSSTIATEELSAKKKSILFFLVFYQRVNEHKKIDTPLFSSPRQDGGILQE